MLRSARGADSGEIDRTAYISATALFSQAYQLNPPPDTLLYVPIPAGDFLMGSDPSVDPNTQEDETDQHTVNLDEYWIMRTEVTNEQYKRCVDADVCEEPSNAYWNRSGSEKLPVTDVDWGQARTYAEWAGGRLCTEAEWEKACRGVDAAIYPWGDGPPQEALANYDYSVGRPMAVGSYPPGAYGLYDMTGNVWEWTSSQYEGYPYSAADGREEVEASGDVRRVLRGGSFYGV